MFFFLGCLFSRALSLIALSRFSLSRFSLSLKLSLSLSLSTVKNSGRPKKKKKRKRRKRVFSLSLSTPKLKKKGNENEKRELARGLINEIRIESEGVTKASRGREGGGRKGFPPRGRRGGVVFSIFLPSSSKI